jgi:hypothetical protein
MFRSMSRTATVAVVALTLVLSVVPAAQASPFGPSFDTRTGWFDVALSWLNGLLFGEETSSPQAFGSTYEASKPVTEETTLGDYTVQTGMCIDPAGRPRPCPEF